MPRFFTADINGDIARVHGGDARHMARSLRMRPGDAVTLCDLSGSDYRCVIKEISDELASAEILEKLPCLSEPRARLLLYQALPKGDKLEFIAQKAVELGVYSITPVLSSRCVSRWDRRDEAKKRERLDRIMLEAAKQSGRGMIPVTEPLCGFREAIAGMKVASLAIMLYEGSKTPLSRFLSGEHDSIAVMVGGEGGFAPEEAAYAEENGVSAVSLGPRILRCETAPLCALSAINFALGEF